MAKGYADESPSRALHATAMSPDEAIRVDHNVQQASPSVLALFSPQRRMHRNPS